MRNWTVAAILLSIASIGVSQIPILDPRPLSPCAPNQDCGYPATRIVPFWDDFPLYWFAEAGLMFLAIGMAGELKSVIRENDEAEEAFSLAP